MSRASFEEKNRLVLEGASPLAAADLEIWKKGRDWLGRKVLATAVRAAQRTGTDPRRHPRVRLAIQAHLAGHGRAFTEDVGFGGMSLRPNVATSLRPGDEASVRLKLGGRSLYVAGRVAWADGNRIGIEIKAIHPADEIVLQAAVCERLLEHWAA